MRDMESAAQKCRGGNCETWNQRHKNAGVGTARHGIKRHKNAGVEIARHGISGTKIQGWRLRDMEIAGKAKYGKPLTAKYWDFTHIKRYAFNLSRFQSVPHKRIVR